MGVGVGVGVGVAENHKYQVLLCLQFYIFIVSNLVDI